MTAIKLLEIVLIVLLLRALFPIFVRLLRGRGKGGAAPVERFHGEKFDRNKSEIEDGEFKELK
jgi:hypothetical protein